MLRQIRALGRSLVHVWTWVVARARSLRVAQPTREVRAPLAEELLAAAQRTREFLCERAITLPAEGRAEPLPPVLSDLAGPMLPTPSHPLPRRRGQTVNSRSSGFTRSRTFSLRILIAARTWSASADGSATLVPVRSRGRSTTSM